MLRSPVSSVSELARAPASAGGAVPGQWTHGDEPALRIALAPIGLTPPSHAPAPCPRCGSYGFNVHQQTWKAIKDPVIPRVVVLRFRCKRCGAVSRQYPDGVQADRQSSALKELSLLLYLFGLPYQGAAAILADLGCRLSPSTVRKNVALARSTARIEMPRRGIKLSRIGPGRLGGEDGRMTVRLGGESPQHRWLEVSINARPEAVGLRWQVEACARWIESIHQSGGR